LDVQLRAVKELIEDRLIGFGQGSFERRSSTAFPLNKLAEWRQGLAHDRILRW
jgi:hypothetical protein